MIFDSNSRNPPEKLSIDSSLFLVQKDESRLNETKIYLEKFLYHLIIRPSQRFQKLYFEKLSFYSFICEPM